jgi:hypothetical protein
MLTPVLVSLAVALVILSATGLITSMAMRSYSQQAVLVTERRKKRKLP